MSISLGSLALLLAAAVSYSRKTHFFLNIHQVRLHLVGSSFTLMLSWRRCTLMLKKSIISNDNENLNIRRYIRRFREIFFQEIIETSKIEFEYGRYALCTIFY